MSDTIRAEGNQVVWRMTRQSALELVDFLRLEIPSNDGFQQDLDALETAAARVRS